MAVRRELGTPLYQQVFLVLREAILTGRHAPGEPMPSEAELGQAYGVSRVTLRRALALLAGADLIERRQGSGTFVRRPPVGAAAVDGSRIVGDIDDLATRTRVRIAEFRYASPSPRVSAAFGHAGHAVMQHAVRVRSLGRVAVAQIETWVPEEIGRRFAEHDLERASMLELLARAGAGIAGGEQIVAATLADPVVADRLAIQIGAPLLEIVRLGRDRTGRLVQYARILARPDRFRLRQSVADSAPIDAIV